MEKNTKIIAKKGKIINLIKNKKGTTKNQIKEIKSY